MHVHFKVHVHVYVFFKYYFASCTCVHVDPVLKEQALNAHITGQGPFPTPSGKTTPTYYK